MFDTKRNIGKSTGESPPTQKFKHNTSTEQVSETPPWPKSSNRNASEDGRAPVQRGGDSSGSGGAGVDSTSLMDFLKRESEKRDEQHQQLVGSMNTLRNTVVDIKNSIDLEKRTR